jgi:uncharacterized membrane protein (UPF0182 family)
VTFHIPDPGQGRRPYQTTTRRPRALVPTLIVLVALLVLFGIFTDFTTDLMWYQSIDYSSVFTTQLVTKVLLFVLFGLLMGAAIAANVVVAYRLRPAYRAMSLEQQSLDRYRMGLDPYRRWVVIAAAGAIGLLAGLSAAGQWRTWMQWRNATPFGQQDPQFGRDVSFYTFSLPWWRFLLGFGFTIVVLSLIAALVTHYLYGGLRLQTPGEKATPAAQAHLSLLLGLFVLLKAVAYWLDRYSLAVAHDNILEGWTGLKYKDVNAVLPAKTILAIIALICAVLFFANVVRRTWMLPGLGFGLLVLAAVLIGGVYPAVVQQFQVRPSESDKEAAYIERNINATRQAYDIADVEPQDYNARTDVEPGQLRQDADTTASVRLLDPSVVSPTFQQLQQIRGFYSFPETLHIDRYRMNGKTQDVVVSVRELDLAGVPERNRNWINDHTFYTHGFGFVAARGNARDAEGKPQFISREIPPTGELGEFESRIYFGEQSPPYSIVGAPDGSPPRELDFPDDTSPNGQRNNTYAGDGGVEMGSLWRQLLFAWKFREEKILLSDRVNGESKILYIREPKERVERVAPWLTLDGNAYPAVVDERIVWIVDGYTTTDNYPYSSRSPLGEVTTTALTTQQRAVIAPRNEVNYIRNSVKATVDAYDGTVTLYTWDEQDPVLQTWKKAFPGTVQDRSEISPELMGHLRYPEDLFKVQRELLRRYHVTDPQAFYGGQDFWRVPADPTADGAATAVTTTGDAEGKAQPPYYLTLQMPGQEAPSFSLTSTFVPVNRPQLAAFMAVNAAPGEDYGTIRVLQLPRNTAVPGPGQVQNNIKSKPEITQQLTLLSRGGQAQIQFGNLLTLPVGGGLLYVEPLYVRAATGTSYPLLQKVIVAFGDQIAMGDSLQQALDAVFRGESGAATGEQPPPRGGPTTPAPSDAAAQLAAAITAAQQAYADGQVALQAGDFAKYGEAQKRLATALERAAAAQRRLNAGGAATPAPSPAPSPSPTGAPA